jgi:hypothetical protein
MLAFAPSQAECAEYYIVTKSYEFEVTIKPDACQFLIDLVNPSHYEKATLDNDTECYYLNMTLLEYHISFQYNGSFLLQIIHPDNDTTNWIYDYNMILNITEGNTTHLSYSRHVGLFFDGVNADQGSTIYLYGHFILLTPLEAYPVNIIWNRTISYGTWLVTDPSEIEENDATTPIYPDPTVGEPDDFDPDYPGFVPIETPYTPNNMIPLDRVIFVSVLSFLSGGGIFAIFYHVRERRL